TKLIAQTYLTPQTIHLLGDTVRLRLAENTGAFLSLGASLSPTLRFWIFTIAAAVMVVGVTVYALTTDDMPRDGIIAMAFVAGGGISNLMDRATRGGSVVDFLNFGIGSLRTGILNVADIAIFFGALYVMCVGFRVEREGSADISGP
ncbi:MAG: signal peptidase II, partial [Anaerolineae bacterium]|nr:signal peptidase II [Anaerolineae bacterium]